MRDKKFTPGPWRTLAEEVDKSYLRIRGTHLGGRYKVCNIHTPTYDGVHEREALETRANAHLIAAALELLEALEQLAEWVYQSESFDRISITDMAKIEAIDKLQADAIAKAYGETL